MEIYIESGILPFLGFSASEQEKILEYLHRNQVNYFSEGVLLRIAQLAQADIGVAVGSYGAAIVRLG